MAVNVPDRLCECERWWRLFLTEDLAPLVRKTFEAYTNKNSLCREVHDKFNALGLKRKSGRELAVSNYQKLL